MKRSSDLRGILRRDVLHLKLGQKLQKYCETEVVVMIHFVLTRLDCFHRRKINCAGQSNFSRKIWWNRFCYSCGLALVEITNAVYLYLRRIGLDCLDLLESWGWSGKDVHYVGSYMQSSRNSLERLKRIRNHWQRFYDTYCFHVT